MSWCDKDPRTVLELLPEELQQVAAKAGVIPVIRLIDGFGGTEIYVPVNEGGARSARTRGVHAAMGDIGFSALCGRFGGGSFHVPGGERVWHRFREDWTERRRDEGATLGEIASQLGVCERTVSRILQSRRTRREVDRATHA